MSKDTVKSLLGDFSNHVKDDFQLSKEHENYKISFVAIPIIKKGGINILGAERSAGKTRCAVDLAYAIAYESQVYLGYLLVNYGSVLYVNLELKGSDFKTYLEASENHYKKLGLVRRHAIKTINLMDNLDLTFDAIKTIIEDEKPSLIIIDGFKMLSSLYALSINGGELKNNHMADFYKQLNSWISASNGSTILLTNHTNKGTSQEASHGDLLFGPGALQDFADQVSLIRKTKNDNERLIIPVKSRFNDESVSGINLFKISSNEDDSQIWLEVLETDVKETDYLNKAKSTYTSDQKLQAKQLCEAGMPYSEVAEQIGGKGMSKGTITKWKRNGWK
jgi:hypothetical protein